MLQITVEENPIYAYCIPLCVICYEQFFWHICSKKGLYSRKQGFRQFLKKIKKDKNLGDGFLIGHSFFCNSNSTDEKEWFNEKSFVEVKTSGSTGTSKVIKIQKLHMIQSAKATGAFFNLVDGTTALLCMSPTYIAGKMMLVRAMILGLE